MGNLSLSLLTKPEDFFHLQYFHSSDLQPTKLWLDCHFHLQDQLLLALACPSVPATLILLATYVQVSVL
jgi:hypothetical protein